MHSSYHQAPIFLFYNSRKLYRERTDYKETTLIVLSLRYMHAIVAFMSLYPPHSPTHIIQSRNEKCYPAQDRVLEKSTSQMINFPVSEGNDESRSLSFLFFLAQESPCLLLWQTGRVQSGVAPKRTKLPANVSIVGLGKCCFQQALKI